MKIIERRFILRSDLQAMCRSNDWMKTATNQEIKALMPVIGEEQDLTVEDIYRIAMAIIARTDFGEDLDPEYEDVLTEAEQLELVMGAIGRICHSDFTVIEEEEE